MTPRLKPIDVIGGLSTAGWYAVPDFVVTRRARFLTKAGLLAGGIALTFVAQPDVFDTDTDKGAGDDAADGPHDTETDEESSIPSGALGGLIVAGAAAVIIGAIALERRVPQLADHLDARGIRHPNTVIGLTLGALTILSGPAMSRLEDRLDALSKD